MKLASATAPYDKKPQDIFCWVIKPVCGNPNHQMQDDALNNEIKNPMRS